MGLNMLLLWDRIRMITTKLRNLRERIGLVFAIGGFACGWLSSVSGGGICIDLQCLGVGSQAYLQSNLNSEIT